MGALGEVAEGQILGEAQGTESLPNEAVDIPKFLRHEQEAMHCRQPCLASRT